MGAPRPLRRGVGAPHQRPLEPVASYLCHFMLTCVRLHIPMTHNDDAGQYKLGSQKKKLFVRLLRNHIVVRVGGGWDSLEHYLASTAAKAPHCPH